MLPGDTEQSENEAAGRAGELFYSYAPPDSIKPPDGFAITNSIS